MLKDGKADYFLIEYKGDEAVKFAHLAKHMLAMLGGFEFQIYQGKSDQKIQLFVKVDNLSAKDASKLAEDISAKLQKHMPKSWKCLPSLDMPDEYNIFTLPYKRVF